MVLIQNFDEKIESLRGLNELLDDMQNEYEQVVYNYNSHR